MIACFVCFVLGFAAAIPFFSRRSAQPLPVETTVVGTRGLHSGRPFTAGGWIEVAAPEYPTVISSRISQRLDKLLVKQGDTVGPGGILAVMYDGDVQARLALAGARAATREEELRIARADYERSAGLEQGAVSEQELDRDLATLNIARASHNAALAELDLARKQLSYCTVSMPADLPPLKVLDVLHRPGDWIALDKNAAILSLYDPSNMQVRVDVPQNSIGSVSPGQTVKVKTEANPNREYAGTVLRIEPLAELAKNTVTVRVKIADPDSLLFPEMTAHVTFQSPETGKDDGHSRMLLPSDAVLGSGESRYVFVYDRGYARRRPVTIGESADNATIITGGVSSGERVITSELDQLSDGRRVQEK